MIYTPRAFGPWYINRVATSPLSYNRCVPFSNIIYLLWVLCPFCHIFPLSNEHPSSRKAASFLVTNESTHSTEDCWVSKNVVDLIGDASCTISYADIGPIREYYIVRYLILLRATGTKGEVSIDSNL